MSIENEASNNLKIFLVPGKDVVWVQSSAENINAIRIYRLDGTQVKSLQDVDSPIIDISSVDLANGIYIMRIKVGKEVYSRKFHIIK